MYETGIRNFAELRGVLAGAPVFSHESRGEKFFTFPIETRRLSGTTDRLNIVARASLLSSAELCEASRIHVTGELRSFNNKRGDGAKLVVTVFAREIYFDDGDDLNLVELSGTLCKPPNLRTTPMGRDICDLMLAVGRRCGRSDYLPCICWGIRAHEAGLWQVGDKVALQGRMQSRRYIKLIDGAAIEKTAFEVSVIDIEKL
ncbi:MAG TPA: single-stranded DNA-binding protein [Clostridiales bacterium]|nr:single-stranded DNA-binding protein [Clostridiales bacterium]